MSFTKVIQKVSKLFCNIKDIRIRDLKQTNERLQEELKYRDRFEDALLKTIEDLEAKLK